MSAFTLRDTGGMLADEHFTHLNQALDRTTFVLWAGRPWQIHGPAGRAAYSHRYPKDT